MSAHCTLQGGNTLLTKWWILHTIHNMMNTAHCTRTTWWTLHTVHNSLHSAPRSCNRVNVRSSGVSAPLLDSYIILRILLRKVQCTVQCSVQCSAVYSAVYSAVQCTVQCSVHRSVQCSSGHSAVQFSVQCSTGYSAGYSACLVYAMFNMVDFIMYYNFWQNYSLPNWWTFSKQNH